MESTDSYKVRLEVFEGPLDLLLYLIKKQKIDIHHIPIATVTKEYLEYLNKKKRININREAEFLFMAALLIYIKSRMLLPREKVINEEDPRQPLVHRLLDYQNIKGASAILRKKEDEEHLKWKRTSQPPLLKGEDLELEEVSLFDLAEAFFSLMKRRESQDFRIIKGKEFSVEEKIKEILTELKKNSFLDFLDYFYQQESLEEALVSFFGLLELIKTKVVVAVQEQLFQAIKVWLTKDYYAWQN
ncbi:MAG: ScpA family protein [Candidatus Aminicenantaceae bacterium]